MWEPGRHRWSKPDSILVATGLGDIDRLFSMALRQARQEGARLVLLHVLTASNCLQVDAGGLPYFNTTQAIDYIEKYLSTFAAEAHRAGVRCEVVVRDGIPSEQIVSTAQRLRVDRILLGTRSRGRWGKLLLGSVAEQVLRSAPVPVLTVGPEAHESVPGAGAVRTILHATSLSKASGPSAALASEIAQMTASRLVLMHVLPSHGAHEVPIPQLTSYAERQLRALIPPEAPSWCIIDTLIRRGDPATEILAQAQASRANLIVLGASKAPIVATLAREGVAYKTIAHAHCPVLTLSISSEAEGDSRREIHRATA